MGKDCQEYVPPPSGLKEQEEEARVLVRSLLEDRLGSKAGLVVRYLGWPGPKRNTMPVTHTAKASIRWKKSLHKIHFFSGVESLLPLPP